LEQNAVKTFILRTYSAENVKFNFYSKVLVTLLKKISYQLMVAHEPGPLLADLKGVFAPGLWVAICVTAILMVLALMILIKKAGGKVDPAEIGVTVIGLLCYQGMSVTNYKKYFANNFFCQVPWPCQQPMAA